MPTVPQRTDRQMDHGETEAIMRVLREQADYLALTLAEDTAGRMDAATETQVWTDVKSNLKTLLRNGIKQQLAAATRDAINTGLETGVVTEPYRVFMRDLSAAVAREHLRAVAIETAGRSEADCG